MERQYGIQYGPFHIKSFHVTFKTGFLPGTFLTLPMLTEQHLDVINCPWAPDYPGRLGTCRVVFIHPDSLRRTTCSGWDPSLVCS